MLLSQRMRDAAKAAHARTLGKRNTTSKMNYCIDAIEGLKTLQTNRVDLVLTSPPYFDMKNYRGSENKTGDDYVEWLVEVSKEIARVLKPDGSFILNILDKVTDGFREIHVFQLVCEIVKHTDLKLYDRLFWNKLKSLPKRGRFSDRVEYVFWFSKEQPKFDIDEFRVPYAATSVRRAERPIRKRYNRDESNQDKREYKDWNLHPKGGLPTTLVNISGESSRKSDIHFAVFPDRFAEYFIKGITKPGDLVVDPFVGSGTTTYCAYKLGRQATGFDLDQDCVNEANQRCKDFLELNLQKVLAEKIAEDIRNDNGDELRKICKNTL